MSELRKHLVVNKRCLLKLSAQLTSFVRTSYFVAYIIKKSGNYIYIVNFLSVFRMCNGNSISRKKTEIEKKCLVNQGVSVDETGISI